jgi:hypothetical protein
VGFDGSRAAPTSSGGARTPHGGASAVPHRSPILRYSGQILMRFGPMASQWRGESIFAHLERRRLTVVAGDGSTIQVDLGDDGSLLQRSVHPVSLVQKRWCDILELAEG